MMTDRELKRLAHLIVLEQASSDEWMKAYVRAQKALSKPERHLVSAKKAADMLGISVWQLYRIKDAFNYVKGSSESSPLRFDASTLVEEYERYVSTQ